MFAELYSDRNERKFNVYVLQYINNQLITTVPQLKNEPIHFFAEEAITVSIATEKNLYEFETVFSHAKQINGLHVFVFSIIQQGEKHNIRRDVRLHTDIPASCSGLDSSNFTLATVLDVSKKGMKIETAGSLMRTTFQISFDNGTRKENRRVKIAWTKKTSAGYLYGLQSVL